MNSIQNLHFANKYSPYTNYRSNIKYSTPSFKGGADVVTLSKTVTKNKNFFYKMGVAILGAFGLTKLFKNNTEANEPAVQETHIQQTAPVQPTIDEILNTKVETWEELFEKTEQVENIKLEQVKKEANNKLEEEKKLALSEYQDVNSSTKQEFQEKIKDLPTRQAAETKKNKIYAEARAKKNKIYTEAQQKKNKIYIEATAKKNKIYAKATAKKNKIYTEATTKKIKISADADTKYDEICNNLKEDYNSKLISNSEYERIKNQAYTDCEKAKSAAYDECEETTSAAYDECEKATSAAYDECEETTSAAYKECEKTTAAAYSEYEKTTSAAYNEYHETLRKIEDLEAHLNKVDKNAVKIYNFKVKQAEEKRDAVIESAIEKQQILLSEYANKTGKMNSPMTVAEGIKEIKRIVRLKEREKAAKQAEIKKQAKKRAEKIARIAVELEPLGFSNIKEMKNQNISFVYEGVNYELSKKTAKEEINLIKSMLAGMEALVLNEKVVMHVTKSDENYKNSPFLNNLEEKNPKKYVEIVTPNKLCKNTYGQELVKKYAPDSYLTIMTPEELYNTRDGKVWLKKNYTEIYDRLEKKEIARIKEEEKRSHWKYPDRSADYVVDRYSVYHERADEINGQGRDTGWMRKAASEDSHAGMYEIITLYNDGSRSSSYSYFKA